MLFFFMSNVTVNYFLNRRPFISMKGMSKGEPDLKKHSINPLKKNIS